MALSRRVHIISDLHLGGVYGPSGGADRGFRICTHADAVAEFVSRLAAHNPADGSTELVINGDMVDFLAEREEGPTPWVPFTHDQYKAANKLSDIFGRDAVIVGALRAFLDRGHKLVLLLGNHDIELALPVVRRRLHEILGIEGRHDFTFLYDGEAYVAGDALIEHGNRYDKFNVVDNDALRRVRSLLSRGQAVPGEHQFNPPAGSRVVSLVINQIKDQYRFVDLLKPENEAVIPIVLALEPGFRSLLGHALSAQVASTKHRLDAPAMPAFGGDISSGAGIASAFGGDMSAGPAAKQELRRADAVSDALARTLGAGAVGFLDDAKGAGPAGSDISAMETIDRTMGIMSMLLSSRSTEVDRRLPSLLKALRAVRGNQAFSREVETDAPTWESAQALATGDVKHVVFGHTHLPKRIALKSGGFYINGGTWADVFEFPQDIVEGSEAEALPRLREFVGQMAKGDFAKWTLFRPTFARLEIDPSGVTRSAELCDYSSGMAL